MKLSEIVSLKSAGALAALGLVLYSPPIESAVIRSLMYLGCILYWIWYCYTSYLEYSYEDKEKQKKLIKSTHNKVVSRLRR